MAAANHPRHVLFVDDEPSMHRIVARTLAESGVRLTCATDGVQALRVLEDGSVDLLVTSLSMLVVDGVELVRHVANRGLAIPVFVATDRDPPAPCPRSPLQFLREPLHAADLVARIRERLEAPPPRPVAVAELAVLLAADRRSCTLRFQVDGVHGELSFRGGVLVDATVGTLEGEPAARALLAMRRGVLRVESHGRARRTTIVADLADLLPVDVDADTSAVVLQLRPALTGASAAIVAPAAVMHGAPIAAVRHTIEGSATIAANAITTRVQAAPTIPEPTIPEPTIPEPRLSDVPAWERPDAAARVAALLAAAMTIDGAIGCGLAVWELDHCIDVRSDERALPLERMRRALSGDARVMRATMQTLRRLGHPAAIHDVLIVLDAQLHVLTPLRRDDGLVLDLVLDRAGSNLALARIRVGALLNRFSLDADP